MRLAIRVLFALAIWSRALVFAQPDPFVRSAWQVLNADLYLMALDAAGDIYVAGRTNEPGFRVPANAFQNAQRGGACQGRLCNDVVIAKISSADGRILAATFLGGSGDDSPTALHIDKASGAVYIAGLTTSRNFPTSESAFQRTTVSASTTFVARLNSSLTALDFGTYLSGRASDRISALAVDAQGYVYVAGVTESPNFPVTSGAYRSTHGPGIIFITRLNTNGSALIASTFLGQGSVGGISADSRGNVIVTGTTNSITFPTTPDAYQPQLKRTPPLTNSDGFITRMPTMLTSISYSTFFGGTQNDTIVDSDIDDAGNVYVTGTSFSRDLPLTVADATVGESGTVFVAKFASSGLLYSRALRGNNSVSATAIEVSPNGAVNVSGFSNATHFPTTAGAYRRCVPTTVLGSSTPFYARLDRDGGIAYSTLLHDSVYESRQWFATLPSGDLYTLAFIPTPNTGPIIGTQPPPNIIRRLNPAASTSRVDCVVNAATYSPNTVSPGLIITIFGSGLGPATGVGGTIENDRVTAAAGGVRVLFDGVPAPILYARQDQVNAIVPFSIADRSATVMTVEYSGATVAATTLPVRAALPGIFRLGATEQAVILNEDGTVNTPENPAARGSLITFWVTGFGQYETAATDGVITGNDLSPIRTPVSVTVQNQSAQLLYAGSAPGMVAGAAQVNARVPASAPAALKVPLGLTIGPDAVQSGAFVSLK